MLRGKDQFYWNKLLKIIGYIYIYIVKIKKKKNLGGHCPDPTITPSLSINVYKIREYFFFILNLSELIPTTRYTCRRNKWVPATGQSNKWKDKLNWVCLWNKNWKNWSESSLFSHRIKMHVHVFSKVGSDTVRLL